MSQKDIKLKNKHKIIPAEQWDAEEKELFLNMRSTDFFLLKNQLSSL